MFVHKSFVMGTDSSSKDTAIVRSVIELGHNLGLEVVAEGVETTRAWDMLVEMGCDVAQGNLVGLPVPAAELLLRLVAFLETGERLLPHEPRRCVVHAQHWQAAT